MEEGPVDGGSDDGEGNEDGVDGGEVGKLVLVTDSKALVAGVKAPKREG